MPSCLDLNTRACVLPMPAAAAISEGKEMTISLFIYFFGTNSATNLSWPHLDVDPSIHPGISLLFIVKSCIYACTDTLPPLLFPNLYFGLESAVCQKNHKELECGGATDHTHTHTHTDVFMKSGQLFSSSTLASTGR